MPKSNHAREQPPDISAPRQAPNSTEKVQVTKLLHEKAIGVNSVRSFFQLRSYTWSHWALLVLFVSSMGVWSILRVNRQVENITVKDGLPRIELARDLLDSQVLRAPVTVYLIWTTPETTFRERNLKVVDTYFFQHPSAKLRVYATHLGVDFFQRYSNAGYDIEIVRLTDDIIVDMGHDCLGLDYSWMSKLEEWQRGPYYYSHITDFVRFCVLFKNGGIYSDFDALLLQRIDEHKEFIGKDSSGANGSCSWCFAGGDFYIAPGLMGAEKGSLVIKKALEIGFNIDTYNASIFNAVGPQAITKAYIQMRKTPKMHIYDTKAFYPYSYLQSPHLLKNITDAWAKVETIRRTSKSLHFYGHQTGKFEVQSDSILQAVFDRFSVIRDGVEECAYIVGADHLDASSLVHLLPYIRVVVSESCKITKIVLTVSVVNGSIREAPNKVFLQNVTVSGVSAAEINQKLSSLVYRPWNSSDPVDVSMARDTIVFGGSITSDYKNSLIKHLIDVYNPNVLVTVIVKTFGRMEKAFNLIRSMRKYYPLIKIVVADDAEDALRFSSIQRDFTYLPLEYDVGLSAGRNAMIDKYVMTPYFLTLDDDFIITENSNIGHLIYALESGEIDIAAGKNPMDEDRFQLDFCGKMRITRDKRGDRELRLEPGAYGETHGCTLVDFVPNIFLARTELFRQTLRWDESLKLGEHEDFFLRAKTLGVRVATCPTVSFNHDQVPHWLRRTKYDILRNRVYDFWRDSLRKHGLVRLISFNRTMMDLVLPHPITCLVPVEVLAYSLALEWYGCSDAPSYLAMYSTNGRNFKTVNGGDGEAHSTQRITIRDVNPNTQYWFMVMAGNNFDYEEEGFIVQVKSLPRYEARGILKNPSFDDGHFGWKADLETHYHIVANHSHSGNFAGRLHIPTRGYNRKRPTWSTIRQTVRAEKSPGIIKWNSETKQGRIIIIAGWSKVERFYGGHLEWRMGVEVEFENSLTKFKYEEDFDSASSGWQVRTFSICISPLAQVSAIRVMGQLIAYRGSVFFDDFTVLLK